MDDTPKAVQCETCKWWDNSRCLDDDGRERPGMEFKWTNLDCAFGAKGGDMGACRAASNYSWGKAPSVFDPHAKMMPRDWTGTHAYLFTRFDHICGEYAPAMQFREAAE